MPPLKKNEEGYYNEYNPNQVWRRLKKKNSQIPRVCDY